MISSKKDINTIDGYIKIFPRNVQSILEKIRQTIRNAAPDAVESISYQIPTFKLNGRYLIYFTAWKKHVSLYPIPSSTEAFKKELSIYIAGKGTIKFLIDKKIPYDLVKKIVKFRMRENL